MGTLIEYLKAPPPVDIAPVDLLTFGLPAYGIPTLRVNLPQTGSEPLRVMTPEPVVATSARPVTAYASIVHPSTDGFADRWPQTASNLPGTSEWMAQQNGGTPTVIYGNTPGVEANSYAPTYPLKPHWLLSAFSPAQN